MFFESECQLKLAPERVLELLICQASNLSGLMIRLCCLWYFFLQINGSILCFKPASSDNLRVKEQGAWDFKFQSLGKHTHKGFVSHWTIHTQENTCSGYSALLRHLLSVFLSSDEFRLSITSSSGASSLPCVWSWFYLCSEPGIVWNENRMLLPKQMWPDLKRKRPDNRAFFISFAVCRSIPILSH